MKQTKLYIIVLMCSAVMMALSAAAFAQTPRLRASNSQVRSLLSRIDSETSAFRDLMDTAAPSTFNNANGDERILDLVGNLQTSVQTVRSTFNSRRTMGAELTDLLDRAGRVDRFVTRNRLTGRNRSQWNILKSDINTLARYYQITWNWQQASTANIPPATNPYTATDYQLRSLIGRIETKTNSFRRAMNISLDNSAINNTNREDSVNAYVRDFENATDRLKESFNGRRSTAADATEVLNRGLFIDRFMANNRQSRSAMLEWSSLRSDLNTLATYYSLSWNWNQQLPTYPIDQYPTDRGGNGRIENRLTGTYRLNTSMSDNVRNVVDNSVRTYPADQQDRVRRGLERRLASPEMIAIQLVGRSVTLASSAAPQVTFDADNVARSETNDRGRTVKTTSTLDNNGLMISYEGDRANDFYVTFSPGMNGRLNVSRRLFLENQNKTITVSSVYDRVSDVAQWSTVNSGPVVSDTPVGVGDFFIPNGTRISARLRGTISTAASQSGDRFTMDVVAPGQYNGAVIEGRVSQAANSGRISGRANVSVDFDTITMNGRTYRFAGIVNSVTAVNGDSVSVNNEGQVRDSNQTTKTVTRAGIGAVIGAIIGGLAGGGQGAAIGAGVGAGAGAGSVLVTGRDRIELGTGSTFDITATAPSGVTARP